MHDFEAEAERTFQMGFKAAQMAWLKALETGMADPVVLLKRTDFEDGTKIDFSCEERGAAAEWLARLNGKAAACLKERNTPALPMTVIVDFAGICAIFDAVDPRVQAEAN